MKRRMGKSNNYSMLRSLCLLEKIFWGQNVVTNKKCVKCSQIHIYQHGRVWVRSVRIFKKMVSLPSKNFRNINRNKQRLIVGLKCLWSFLDLRNWWLRRKTNGTCQVICSESYHTEKLVATAQFRWFLFSLYILSVSNCRYSSEELVIILWRGFWM